MDEKQFSKLNRRTRFTQFLVWIALFFTAAGIAAGYKNWLRIHEKAKASLAGVESISSQLPSFAKKKQLDQLVEQVNTLSKEGSEHLDGALKELRGIQDSTQHLADTVYEQVKNLTVQQQAVTQSQPVVLKDWSLEEIRFLLQTANQVFNLKQDREGAIKAFNLADKLLIKEASTDLLPLRKQISSDIALLKQYAPADTVALSNKIDTLLEQLKPVYKIKQPEVKPKELSEIKSKSKEEASESLVNRVKKTLNEAVVVKKFDKPLLEEMDDVTKNSLYQLLSLRLETLRLMLLQGQNENYHEQIGRLKTLLKRYYSPTKYALYEKRLDELDAVNLAPKIPDVSASLKLLDAIMQGKKGK